MSLTYNNIKIWKIWKLSESLKTVLFFLELKLKTWKSLTVQLSTEM